MSNCCANSASVSSPLTAASATFALNAGVWFRRGRLLMFSPVRLPSWPPAGRNSNYSAVQILPASSLRAIASLIIIIGVLALLGWAVWPALELPRVAITGYDVILFKPYQSTFVNIYFRNVGGPGNITIYSAAGFALATANPRDIKNEVDSFTQKGVAAGCGLAFSLKPQEIKWFTVIGPLLTPQQAELLRKGTYAFYFSGTIIRGFDGRNYDFCSFVEGNKPNVVLQCPEQ